MASGVIIDRLLRQCCFVSLKLPDECGSPYGFLSEW